MKKMHFIVSILIVITVACNKDGAEHSETYEQLTKSQWVFYPVRPGSVIIGIPDYSYSVYHVPPNSGIFGLTGHTLFFKEKNELVHTIDPVTSWSWLLDENLKDIYVTAKPPNGAWNSQVWTIDQLSDTLLMVKVRAATEPANTDNYYGYKYRRP